MEYPDRTRAVQLVRQALSGMCDLDYIPQQTVQALADMVLKFAIDEVKKFPMACYVTDRVADLENQLVRQQ